MVKISRDFVESQLGYINKNKTKNDALNVWQYSTQYLKNVFHSWLKKSIKNICLKQMNKGTDFLKYYIMFMLV